jgi:hypothetical protein
MKRLIILALMTTLLTQGFVHSALALIPNDTFYSRQWYLRQIQMEEAWDTSVGSSDVIVAVIDTGVDIYHEDLEENIWTNRGEIPGNKIDDDSNGFVDDVQGWNFVLNSNDIRPWGDAESDEAFVHGTLVASIIGAKGNNGKGIAGIAWNVRIMSLVALNDEGSGNTIDVANAVYYAAENGADIINLSIEGSIQDIHLDEALAFARSRGVLTITAAGNSEDIGGLNLNITPVYPACSGADGMLGVVTVGGTDHLDKKSIFANYGECIDVSAPSESIFAARPLKRGANGEIVAPGYEGGYSGTSLAVPIVSGLAALLKSRHPHWGTTELRDRIMAGTVSIDNNNPQKYWGDLGSGRINAALALNDAYFIEQGKEPLELQSTNPGVPTRVRIFSETDIIEVAPFDADDTRGARAVFVDINEDGTPEIAVVPATGDIAEWTLLGRDGQIRSQGELPGELVDGALIAGIDGGFMIADESGGQAWGVDGELIAHAFYPYESHYDLGLDLLEIDGAAAFAPRMSGGRLVITNVMGDQLVSAFPFGIDVSGRWSVAKIMVGDAVDLVFSGTSGTKKLDSKHLGQTGWQDVSFTELMEASLTLSSGKSTDQVQYRLYDEWPQ